MTGERITYGVFYAPKTLPNEWRIFTKWHTSYSDAKEEAEILLKNPRFKVAIVKRVETFEITFGHVGTKKMNFNEYLKEALGKDPELKKEYDALVANEYMSSIEIHGNRIVINGKELPPCPAKHLNITQVNGKVYIDGYEFKRGKWCRTIKALFHKLF